MARKKRKLTKAQRRKINMKNLKKAWKANKKRKGRRRKSRRSRSKKRARRVRRKRRNPGFSFTNGTAEKIDDSECECLECPHHAEIIEAAVEDSVDSAARRYNPGYSFTRGRPVSHDRDFDAMYPTRRPRPTSRFRRRRNPGFDILAGRACDWGSRGSAKLRRLRRRRNPGFDVLAGRACSWKPMW